MQKADSDVALLSVRVRRARGPLCFALQTGAQDGAVVNVEARHHRGCMVTPLKACAESRDCIATYKWEIGCQATEFDVIRALDMGKGAE